MQAQAPTPQTTLLILLGASAWPFSPEFQTSEAFAKAAWRLKNYFLNPSQFGLPIENLLDLFDSDKSADELDVEMSQFLEQRLINMKKIGNPARDLLLYFVGHGGFVGRDADLYLAIRRTRMGNPRTSGLQMMSLADTLAERVRFLRRIIILDCCFAAAAFAAFQSGPDQVALKKACDAFEITHKAVGFPKKGTTLLCSSSHKSPSLLLPDGSSTMFTQSFLDALARGSTSPRDRLTLREVKDVAAGLLYEIRNAPMPVVLSPDQSEGDVADIPFFPNPRIEEERRRTSEERIRQAEEEARVHQVGQSESKAVKDHAEQVLERRASLSTGHAFQEPTFLEKAEINQQVPSLSTSEQGKHIPVQQLSAPNLSSYPARLSLIRIVFSVIGMIWGGIGCILAFQSLVSVGLRLFPAGIANVFLGFMIFFVASLRTRSRTLFIIGIVVGIIAILSGIGLLIIAAIFPNAIINEVSGGLGSAGIESGTVTIIVGSIILGSDAFSMIRR